MNRIDVLKSGGPAAGFTFYVYHNWQLVAQFEDTISNARERAVGLARDLAAEHKAKLAVTI